MYIQTYNVLTSGSGSTTAAHLEKCTRICSRKEFGLYTFTKKGIYIISSTSTGVRSQIQLIPSLSHPEQYIEKRERKCARRIAIVPKLFWPLSFEQSPRISKLSRALDIIAISLRVKSSLQCGCWKQEMRLVFLYKVGPLHVFCAMMFFVSRHTYTHTYRV